MRQSIFFVLISLCFACKKRIDPEDSLLGNNAKPNISYSDSLLPSVSSVREDPIRTSNLSYNLVGNITDPVFGQSYAETYAQLLTSSSSIDFGRNPTLDSVVLYLKVLEFYGNTSTPLNFVIRELDEAMDSDKEYYSDETLSVKTVPLGSAKIAPKEANEVIPIKLSKQFGDRLLNESGSSNLANAEAFLNFFKGILITVDSGFTANPIGAHYKTADIFTEVPSEGSIAYLDLQSSSSKLTLFYSTSDEDSLSTDFLITSNSARFSYYNNNQSNSLSQSYINGSNDSLIFIESMSGLKGLITLPDLSNLSNVLINKAELEFSQVHLMDQDSFLTTPSEMAIIKVGEDGSNNFEIPDIFDGVAYYGGTRSNAINVQGQLIATYRFNIARYVQEVVDGKSEDNGLYLVSVPSALIADRLVLGGNNQDHEGVKFTLIYTETN